MYALKGALELKYRFKISCGSVYHSERVWSISPGATGHCWPHLFILDEIFQGSNAQAAVQHYVPYHQNIIR